MNKNKKSISKCMLSFLIICVIVVFGTMLLFSCQSIYDFQVGGSENLKLLNSLNEGWTLNESYEIDKFEVDGINMEWLYNKNEAPNYAILQLHGGAYIRSLNFRENLYQRIAEQYAIISSAAVLSVDYRIAPENPYPAALEDALLAYNYLLDLGFMGQNIIIAGDSAGGGLALALTLYLRDNKMEMPCAVITMSAWTDLDYRRKPAYVGENNPKNPYISPIYGDFTGFPPMLMQAGTKDIDRQTITVAQNALGCNVNVTYSIYQKMPHVFQALFPAMDAANDAWNDVKDFLLANVLQ